MHKRLIIWGLAAAGLIMGFVYTSFVNESNHANRKPVINAVESAVVKNDIVLEREYLRCGHTIISAYDGKKSLKGKTLAEVRQLFSAEEGYKVNIKNDTLVIHEKVNDWCPNDKQRCRLKEYHGMVAVYQGPKADADSLLRVTGIKMSSLPAAVQNAVRNGQYEFETQEALNDALENLDEYL
ncbi:MAG TPA: hypothetical protein VHQ70_10965 [Syntrophomonadaceae bacterium]|nr:hypothetical protein [Syntrophomonadaceae bacterium]